MSLTDLSFSSKEESQSYLASIIESYGSVIAGLDEVGRGPLFGPVVVSCVVLPTDHGIVGIKDSKKLTPKKRESLFEEIISKAKYGIGAIESDEIDRINIFQAVRKAALIAFQECHKCSEVSFLLCDGGLDLSSNVVVPTASVIKGDLWFECIGAASIVAKVYRDRQMSVYHEVWPEYNFANNQGYGTKDHLKAIAEFGILSNHRKSFGICRTAKLRAE